MEKYKITPKIQKELEYMTVGELAKKMGVTVRTLQYYDKEGLLSPSSESEGGRRLYTHKDMILLHQILSMKHLGFSLSDIKNRLTSLETPADIAQVLTEQAITIQEKIDNLSESLKEIEALKAEVLQMQSVDFKKYADIIVNLQMKNEFYWLIKHLDDTTLNYLRSRFDLDSGSSFLKTFQQLLDQASKLKEEEILPESEQGMEFAKEFWDMVLEFTNGDMSLLPKLTELGNSEKSDTNWSQKQTLAFAFIQPALEAYFTKLDYDPFEPGKS